MAVTHKVVKGDTLWALSRKYGTTVDAIAKLNNIKNVNLIYVGQVLTISGQSSTDVVSGNTSGSSSTTSSPAVTQPTVNNATVTAIGLQSDTDNTYFATWTWSKDNTDKYEIEWDYYTANNLWFIGSHTTVDHTTIQATTYTPPSNATVIRFRVKPVSTTYTKDNNQVSYWTASWTAYSQCNVIKKEEEYNLPTPPAPELTISGYTLTCRVDNVNDYNDSKGAPYIEFEVVRDDTVRSHNGIASLILNGAAYSCNIDAGYKYKARARMKQESLYGEWSPYSTNVVSIPSAPSSITSCKAASESSILLTWNKVSSAKTYTIEYTTNKDYFNGSNATSKIDGVETNQYTVTGLESGKRYFLRVRSVNEQGESGWTDSVSVIIGTKPIAPTTWSSTYTAISGEELILYWMHNSEDNSIETLAEVEINDGIKTISYTVSNPESETQKENKTSQYSVQTGYYTEGTTIKWRVRTAGITREYGDWSTQRTVSIYAPPSLELSVLDKNNNPLNRLTSFPFYINAKAGPDTQNPISFNVSIVSLDSYETVDEIGNFKMVIAGDMVYSGFHDISQSLSIEMLPNHVDLQNGARYRIDCVVAMDSGLTGEASHTFDVSWIEQYVIPDAEIMYDPEQYVVHMRPKCEYYPFIFYKVNYTNQRYVKSNIEIEHIEGISVDNALTTTDEIVYAGYLNNALTHFCIVQSEVPVPVPNITLSVYRKDPDGKFIEIATNIKNKDNAFVTDPHPNLNIVKYRVVAISDDTGSVSYVDLPGYFINEKAIVLQWNETWKGVNMSDDGSIIETAWVGSRIRLPYNIDISESNSIDMSLVEYIGREHPVSYYGTHVGTSATWSVDIPKTDIATLTELRKLAVWMGDVYVREPSGTGYWAKVDVSFNRNHKEVVIPVTIKITRVDGGM